MSAVMNRNVVHNGKKVQKGEPVSGKFAEEMMKAGYANPVEQPKAEEPKPAQPKAEQPKAAKAS